MASNTTFSTIIAVPNVAGNILNPGTVTGGVNATPPVNTYMLLKKIRIVNKNNVAVAISAWIGATGATAAGTEFAWNAYSIPANSYVDWNSTGRILNVADFLVMLASAATSLVANIDGEIGLVS